MIRVPPISNTIFEAHDPSTSGPGRNLRWNRGEHGFSAVLGSGAMAPILEPNNVSIGKTRLLLLNVYRLMSNIQNFPDFSPNRDPSFHILHNGIEQNGNFMFPENKITCWRFLVFCVAGSIRFLNQSSVRRTVDLGVPYEPEISLCNLSFLLRKPEEVSTKKPSGNKTGQIFWG